MSDSNCTSVELVGEEKIEHFVDLIRWMYTKSFVSKVSFSLFRCRYFFLSYLLGRRAIRSYVIGLQIQSQEGTRKVRR